MSQLFRLPSSVKRDSSIEIWMKEHTGELGEIAKHWVGVMRARGDDVREVSMTATRQRASPTRLRLSIRMGCRKVLASSCAL